MILNNLRTVRENKGFSQAELSRLTGVSRQVISAIETNQQLPSLPLALRISHELKTHVEQLFTQEEDEYLDKPEPEEVMSNWQRLNFANQYSILKGISALRGDDSEVKRNEYLEQIFLHGYTYLYREAIEFLYKEMPEAESKEVLSILDMHRTLLWSLGNSPSKEDLKKVKFLGFDGNNEASQLVFAEFYQNDPSIQKFKELKVVNSHHPTMERYRKMLAEWDKLARKPQLTRKEIDLILDAGKFS